MLKMKVTEIEKSVDPDDAAHHQHRGGWGMCVSVWVCGWGCIVENLKWSGIIINNLTDDL